MSNVSWLRLFNKLNFNVMDWKIGLDRYLTSEPNNDFNEWCEEVINYISDKFYNENESWLNDYNGQCNKWLNKLYDSNNNAVKSAFIIERAFNIFVKIN